MVYPFSGTLLSNEEEQTTDTATTCVHVIVQSERSQWKKNTDDVIPLT